MRKISFSHVEVSPGEIHADFKEDNNGLLSEDSFYITFDPFLPSEDTVSLAFGSFCGKAYNEVYMDLSVGQNTFEKLKNLTGADLSFREVRPENYPFSATPYRNRLRNRIKWGNAEGKKTILNFSGGMDSLALLCALPSNINLCAIYFEGFEREKEYFEKYRPHLISTNVRRKISIDRNAWQFMGFGSLLYKEYLGADYSIFGTVAEAWQGNLIRRDTVNNYDPILSASGMELPHLSHALTKLGTAIVVGKYMPEELAGSLRSLAAEGSEKLYRKECLVNIAGKYLGMEPVVRQYHYPRQKIRFGSAFGPDAVSFCIAKHLGIEYAARIYEELPTGFEDFVKNHELAFYRRIKEDNISQRPERLVKFFKNRVETAGLEYYTGNDYLEAQKVREFILACAK